MSPSISKFYLHIKGKESESLLNQSLQTSIQLHNDCYNKSCYSGVETILNEIKLDECKICLIKNSLKIKIEIFGRKKSSYKT